MTYLRLLAGFLERERLPGYLLYKLSNIYLNIFISKLMKSKTLKIHSKRQMPGIVKGKVWPPEAIVSTCKEVPQGLDRGPRRSSGISRAGHYSQATRHQNTLPHHFHKSRREISTFLSPRTSSILIFPTPHPLHSSWRRLRSRT